MKVSGFTFIRNGIKFDYPFLESIQSLLPLVDELVVAYGDSEDGTLAALETLQNPKIKIIHTVWDESLREGGRVLAVETDKALQATAADSDWLIYLQGDELLHEKYYDNITNAMKLYKDDTRVQGLLFHYLHFYGSYNYLGDGRRWYDKEIRIIRNNKKIESYRDAQGFRIDNRKLQVKLIDAYIYHYGWVKSPFFQQAKQNEFGKWWSKDAQFEKKIDRNKQIYKYEENIDTIRLFTDTHPTVIQQRVASENWETPIDIDKKKFKNLKHSFLYALHKYTGWRPFAYKNYKKI
jgi:hypothetical protein